MYLSSLIPLFSLSSVNTFTVRHNASSRQCQRIIILRLMDVCRICQLSLRRCHALLLRHFLHCDCNGDDTEVRAHAIQQDIRFGRVGEGGVGCQPWSARMWRSRDGLDVFDEKIGEAVWDFVCKHACKRLNREVRDKLVVYFVGLRVFQLSLQYP